MILKLAYAKPNLKALKRPRSSSVVRGFSP